MHRMSRRWKSGSLVSVHGRECLLTQICGAKWAQHFLCKYLHFWRPAFIQLPLKVNNRKLLVCEAEEKSNMSFSIAAKSQKYSLNSTKRNLMAAAFLFVLAPTLSSCRRLSMTSCKAGKCAMQGSVCDKCLWKRCNLVPKALISTYSWLTTVSCPWRLTVNAFRCLLCQPKKLNMPAKRYLIALASFVPFQPKNWLYHLQSVCCTASPYVT